MTSKWLKILKKENNKVQILSIINKILLGNIEGLDILKIKGKDNYYRCRIGKIRIVYYCENGKNFVSKVGYRGDVYKGL